LAIATFKRVGQLDDLKLVALRIGERGYQTESLVVWELNTPGTQGLEALSAFLE